MIGEYVLWYFVIGALFDMIMVWLNRGLPNVETFGTNERIFLILLWPIGVIVFVYGFISGGDDK